MKNYNLIIFGISAAIVASVSYALMPSESDKERIIEALKTTAPAISPAKKALETAKLAPAAPENNLRTEHYPVQAGDSLSGIFRKLKLSFTDLYHITHAKPLGREFSKIIPGKTLEIKTDKDGNLEQLIYPRNILETLVATRSKEGFAVELISKDIDARISSVQGVINSSLFVDGKKAGLPDRLIMQLADIFAWDVDFALNIRPGDQFTVLYKTLYVNDKEVITGDIIAAEFVNRGKTYTAVLFEDDDGKVNYYTPDGRSMRKAFLRTPVDFARISSRFNLRRKHPVLNRIRAHKGVDYAAKKGTPVKVTGDGVVTFRGHKGGYGRVVIIQHGQHYSTLYAHLSKYKRGLKKGDRVKQGDVIAYVGMSGLATGPHLHYEFRIDGAHRNPLTVKLPHQKPISKYLMAEFKRQTGPLLAQLEQTKKTLLAKNEN
jgi:murein DD-endopeptidase MepM/ murein hydrolase activator NlpD